MIHNKKELKLFQKLNTPAKIQDYINSLGFNFEKNVETLSSPRVVILRKTAHCIEGAILASEILAFHKFKNFLIDLKCRKHARDYDHVICVFQIGKYFGAISKTNHAVLRFREPVYTSVRELVMSYFHEYFLPSGTKTLDSYSQPFDLKKYDKNPKLKDWRVTEKDLWFIGYDLDKSKHFKIVPKNHLGKLRKADKIEVQAGQITEYPA